jgi:hypothetical protein
MTATLTERYISATIRSIPASAQEDVRVELETSIADAIDAKIEEGEDRVEAERAVLTELGDPGILAAGYADRPLHLIGPKYYLTWWRLLKLLLWIVPVCVAFAVGLGLTLSNAPVGEIIGQTIAVTLSVIAHLCFWVTAVFALLERTGADTGVKWDVDQLPEPQDSQVPRSELIASLVFLGIAVGALLWDFFRGFFPTGGDVIPILNPTLWPWTMAVLFAIIALEAAFAIAIYIRGRWTRAMAIINTVLALMFAAWSLGLLIAGQLVNPEFLAFIADAGGDGFAAGDAEAAGNGGIFRILAVVLGFGLAIGVGWDIVDGWRKALRSERAAAGIG